ncbi:DMT family transporter [Peribacillus butanolivorans]|uniref:DMT family transporter n=1 Tax=Peribacillus butanolivorans TaxID=421767 RepID=UPI0028526065|nr:DMT family transporter [Peribacillus butanolivorans]
MCKRWKSKRLSGGSLWYVLGGMFGVSIVLGEMTAINILGMSFEITTLLISQLLSTFIVNAKGIFLCEETRGVELVKQL